MPFGQPQRRDRYGRDLSIAMVVAVLGLIVAAWFGPSIDQVEEWLLHTGVEGELVLLDEIDIVPDEATVSMPPKRKMAGATQGVEVEVERPTPDRPDELEPTPQRRGYPDASEYVLPTPRPGNTRGLDSIDQPEMHRPAQRSLDFILVKFVRPDYPTSASSAQRSRVITVHVAMYVDENGRVVDAYILSSDGGPVFDDAVLRAVRQWEYQPRVTHRRPEPFWDQQKVSFIVTEDGARASFKES